MQRIETPGIRLDLVDWYNSIRFQRLESLIFFIKHQSQFYCDDRKLLKHVVGLALELQDVMRGLQAQLLTILEMHQCLDEIVVTIQAKLDMLSTNELDELKEIIESAYLTDTFEHTPSDFVKLMLEQDPSYICLWKSEIPYTRTNRICFRGDSRNPVEIFTFGFKPVSSRQVIAFQPYSSQPTVIGFTPRFCVAACFPWVPTPSKATWVYVMKSLRAFDLAAASFVSFDATDWGADKDAVYAMFANELITDCVEPESVIAAIEIQRSIWQKCPSSPCVPETYKQAGRYTIISYQFNPAAQIEAEEKELITRFIETEKALCAKPKVLPLPESGFKKQLFFKPASERWSSVQSSSAAAAASPSAVSRVP